MAPKKAPRKRKGDNASDGPATAKAKAAHPTLSIANLAAHEAEVSGGPIACIACGKDRARACEVVVVEGGGCRLANTVTLHFKYIFKIS